MSSGRYPDRFGNVASLEAARRRIRGRAASIRPSGVGDEISEQTTQPGARKKSASAHPAGGAARRMASRRMASRDRSGDRSTGAKRRGEPERHRDGEGSRRRRSRVDDPRVRLEKQRIAVIFLVFILALGAEVIQLGYMQGFESSKYRSVAANQRLRTEALSTPRGDILDSEGRPLAVSVERKTVVADPKAIDDPQRTALLLADALKLDARDILPKLVGERNFSYVARKVEDDAADRVRNLRLKGITLVSEARRHYPGGTFAANLLGFVGTDNQGLAGIEQQAQESLAGRPGEVVVEQDPEGRPIPQAQYRNVPPIPGRDVFLTIDSEIQFQAERILAEAVAEYKAKGGAILLVDVKTGGILAAANNPTFDPNEYWKAEPDARKNRIATDAFEPGSTNKVITAAAALEEKVVSLDERFGVPYKIRVADAEFKDAEEHPPVSWNLRQIMVHSSNVGTIRVAQRVGAEKLDRYLRAFGYGTPTGSGFPGESEGLVIPVEKWWGTSIATVPIGQGIAVTGLQMAQVYATVANDGVWVKPHLVKGVRGDDGNPVFDQPPVGRRVISPETAAHLREMLGGVVAEGTGRRAAVDGHQVGGKTGTARKPSEGGGYQNAYIASFVGFAPVENPRVVAAVILDEPTPYYGGHSAAPTWSRIMTFALSHLGVPQSGDQRDLARGPVRPMAVESVPGGAVPKPTSAASPKPVNTSASGRSPATVPSGVKTPSPSKPKA